VTRDGKLYRFGLVDERREVNKLSEYTIVVAGKNPCCAVASTKAEALLCDYAKFVPFSRFLLCGEMILTMFYDARDEFLRVIHKREVAVYKLAREIIVQK
jgi:hypothetical protein